MKHVFAPALFCLLLAACHDAPPSEAKRSPNQQPERIVSLNLCTDQLLVALADRGQIAGLTRNARDADMSWVADRVAGLPILGSAAEQVIAIQPDLVLGMPASRSATLGTLQDQQYRTLDLEASQNVEDIYRSIRLTAQAVGQRARGDAMVSRMEQDLANIAAVGAGRVAAYYQRRGYLSGSGTLIDDMMRRLGLVNLAATLAGGPLAQLSLEEMVAAQPDFIIMETATKNVTDQGSEMLHHEALRHIPRLYVPEAMTVCGNPSYVTAAKKLEQQILAYDAKR
jgi:iron complex transport system substrate-binding protein